jgi:hypothetical protein
MMKFSVKEGEFINVNGVLFQINDGNVTHLPAPAKPTVVKPLPKCFGTCTPDIKATCLSRCDYTAVCLIAYDKIAEAKKDKKGNIELPECLGQEKNAKCSDFFKCKKACNRVRDNIADAKKERANKCDGCGYIEAYKIRELKLPDCFGMGCKNSIDCKCEKECSYVRSEIQIALKVAPEGYVKGGAIPTCFSSLRANKGRNCTICTDRDACSAIYDKVNAAKETVPEGYVKEGPAVPAPVPECFSSMLPNRLGRCVHCAYSSSCKKACDNIVHTVSKALEPVPEGITPPCLGCIDQYIDKLSDGCVGCDSRELCIKTHYKIKNTKKVKPLPGCFSSINPSKASGCNPCSYNGQCKIAYIKIQNKERDMASICLGAVKESLLNAFPKTKTNTSLPWES